MSLSDFHALASANAYESDCYEDRERRFWRSLGCPGGGSSVSRGGRSTGAADAAAASASPKSPNGGSAGWIDPLYGADAAGTLFRGETACGWNVDTLDSMLRLLPDRMDGVTHAMLYVGMWRAMFAFHVEDMNLYSINYIHTGAAKSWYSVPQRLQQRFETLAQAQFPHEYHACREFLRHKTSVLSPLRIRQAGLQMHTAVQEAGEFIVTFPGAYHQGFNHGFNVAESSNFALLDWIPLGRRAKICRCEPFNCSIDVDLLETLHLRRERAVEIQAAAYAAAYGQEARTVGAEFIVQPQAASFRCCCGVRGSLPLRLPPRAKPKGGRELDGGEAGLVVEASGADLFLCGGCGLHAHDSCVRAWFAKKYAQPLLRRKILCHLCLGIELSAPTPWEEDPEADVDFDDVCVGASTAANSEYEVEDSDWGLLRAELRRAARRGVQKTLQGRKGDAVRLVVSGAEGTIVDIFDDGSLQGRVHIRGTRKAEDVWIDLLDPSIYTVLQPPALGSSHASPRCVGEGEGGNDGADPLLMLPCKRRKV